MSTHNTEPLLFSVDINKILRDFEALYAIDLILFFAYVDRYPAIVLEGSGSDNNNSAAARFPP